jgi:hypothetical protein
MARITRDSSVLNQFGSPSLNSNTIANRPAAGQTGRLFIDTTNNIIQRDTGSSWVTISGGGGSQNLQSVTTIGNTTTNNILVTARENLFTKTFNTGDIVGDATNILNIVSNVTVSSANLGLNNILSESYKEVINNITLEQDSTNDNIYIFNRIGNNSLSPKTITVTQGTFINALSGLRIQSIFSNINSLTISHYASIIVNPLTMVNSTITNYYGLLINNSTGSTITNRWGIYQAGNNDYNYFASKVLIGTTTPDASLLKINGSITATEASITNQGFFGNALYVGYNGVGFAQLYLNVQGVSTAFTVQGATLATGVHTTSGNHLPIKINGVTYWLALLNPPVLP